MKRRNITGTEQFDGLPECFKMGNVKLNSVTDTMNYERGLKGIVYKFKQTYKTLKRFGENFVEYYAIIMCNYSSLFSEQNGCGMTHSGKIAFFMTLNNLKTYFYLNNPTLLVESL